MFGWVDEWLIYLAGAATVYSTMVPSGKRKATELFRSAKYRITGRRF
jgi:hypothetical protein